MTQLGEGVAIAVLPPGGKEDCVFCHQAHQEEKAAGPHEFARDMGMLKKQGRAHTLSTERVAKYPDPTLPPLVEWSSDITATGGYKAAAHHCIALKTASEHRLSGELHEAGYDPNRGSNCIWLPYSRPQFIRARAYDRPLQKHRGGHTNEYFETVAKQLDQLASLINQSFCAQNKQASRDRFMQYMLAREGAVWLGVANAVQKAYWLYNESYLEPRALWGHFVPEEKRPEGSPISKSEYLGREPNDSIDARACEDDPE